jgi:D-beta-D-heptose 7-phosphate kinase/D-beta-D-heptose 1-phosphate adenosyltransferase
MKRNSLSKRYCPLELEPRSAYIMQGPVRWDWQHRLSRKLKGCATRSRFGAKVDIGVIGDDAERFKEAKPLAVKPNFKEATLLGGFAPTRNRVEQITANQKKLFERTGASIIAVTADTDGSVVLERGKAPYHTRVTPVRNSKTIGAGDTYSSAFFLSLLAELSPQEAGEVASAAASIVVRKDGTTFCTHAELAASFALKNKHLKDSEELKLAVDEYRRQYRNIVFTNGCFDILHSGHVEYLRKAKALGDVLIVGVNSDASIKRLKGENRPVNRLEDRLKVLSALGNVDHVISFEEDNAIKLIEEIRPEIYAKGADYSKKALPEASVVKKHGGRIELVELTPDKSTTNTIQRIVSLNEKKLEL